MCGEIICGAARRRGHEDAVADELIQTRLAVEHDAELRRLMRLAQKRHLVEGERGALTHGRYRSHQERADLRGLRGLDPLRQIVLAERIHQESDGAEIHAVDRNAAVEERVQRLEHEPVAAQRDDDIGGVWPRIAIARVQSAQHRLRFRRIGSDEMEFLRHQGRQPPVSDI